MMQSAFKSGEDNEFIYTQKTELTGDNLGSVYCFGGKGSKGEFCIASYKYDIAAD